MMILVFSFALEFFGQRIMLSFIKNNDFVAFPRGLTLCLQPCTVCVRCSGQGVDPCTSRTLYMVVDIK